MTPDTDFVGYLYSVNFSGTLDHTGVDYDYVSIRPVINLLETAIPPQS